MQIQRGGWLAIVRSGVAARLLSVAALSACVALPAWADCKLKTMDLPVKMVGAQPIAMVGLNGKQVPMLVDTGAASSALTAAAALQLQLHTRPLPEGMHVEGVTGPSGGRITRVGKVELLGGVIPDVDFFVGMSELGSGAMGLIGRNFLGVADSEYDLAHGMIRLIVPDGDCDQSNMAYWAGDAPVNVMPLELGDIREAKPGFVADVRVNGRRLTALLDSGAIESSLALSAAESAGIKEAAMTPAGAFFGMGSSRQRLWTANVDTFEIGGERVLHSKLSVMDSGWLRQDMLLGIDYFLSHRILVSRSQGKVYATWNGGAVFSHNVATGEDDSAAASAGTSVESTDADGLVRRAAAFAARNDFDRALADLNRACALAPGMASCFATRASVQLAMNHVALARRDFDEALRLDPADERARESRARLRAMARDVDGALSDLRTLDTALPPQSSLRAAMATDYATLEMPAEALRQSDLWLADHAYDANRAVMLNLRCWMRVQLDIDIDHALDDCREAVRESPDDAVYLKSLGWVYVRRAEYQKAIKVFDGAIAAQPAYAWALYGRGVAQLRLGAPALAQGDLARARKLQPVIDEHARKHGMAAE